MTDKLQLDKVFSTMVVSAEEGVMKPDPLLYEITLERCGVSASEAVFIDDFPQNVKAAKEVGMLAIWFRSREQTILD
ncbi:HAD-IA family hydrolase, partial [Klebsiella pneumoniae]|uniref:HAD-IA family hydrolase n=1 Tax=Klebsiella pneumoniae TaxID=573 RepID=UPI0030190D90